VRSKVVPFFVMAEGHDSNEHLYSSRFPVSYSGYYCQDRDPAFRAMTHPNYAGLFPEALAVSGQAAGNKVRLYIISLASWVRQSFILDHTKAVVSAWLACSIAISDCGFNMYLLSQICTFKLTETYACVH